MTNLLTQHEKVFWAEQQQSRYRTKRDFLDKRAQEDRVYRSVSFSDPQWNKEWYLVSLIFLHVFSSIITFELSRKIHDQQM